MPGVREQLRTLYELHRRTPFPPSHSDGGIQAVHDRLIVHDAEIAGLVSRILEGELNAVGLLKEDSGVRDEITRLLSERGEAVALLRRYLEELERLSQMIALARRLTGEPRLEGGGGGH